MLGRWSWKLGDVVIANRCENFGEAFGAVLILYLNVVYICNAYFTDELWLGWWVAERKVGDERWFSIESGKKKWGCEEYKIETWDAIALMKSKCHCKRIGVGRLIFCYTRKDVFG